MHALDVLGDPVRRQILSLLAGSSCAAGDIVTPIQEEFGITQPAVSQHLRILRDSGFATVRAEGKRRIYSLEPAPLAEVDQWLDPFRQFWEPKLLALGTEIARGKRAARSVPAPASDTTSKEPS